MNKEQFEKRMRTLNAEAVRAMLTIVGAIYSGNAAASVGILPNSQLVPILLLKLDTHKQPLAILLPDPHGIRPVLKDEDPSQLEKIEDVSLVHLTRADWEEIVQCVRGAQTDAHKYHQLADVVERNQKELEETDALLAKNE